MDILVLICAICVVQLIVNVVSENENTLQLVHLLYRHGDRAPIHTYKKNPHKEDEWPQGYSQLTQTGMRQHFELGKFLRKRYTAHGFLNGTYINNEIFIRSSDKDRTLMSAYSNLAGLYPPEGDEVWSDKIKWQPIPVHTKPLKDDVLLHSTSIPCPHYDELLKQVMGSHDVKEYIKINQKYIDFVSEKTGMNKTPRDMWDIEDALFCQEKHNFTQPHWLNSTIRSFLWDINRLKHIWQHREPDMKKIRSGSLIATIVSNMEKKSQDKLKPKNRKIIMYSAHDTTEAGLQQSLGIYNENIPPYASCTMIELHRKNKKYHVEIYYRNETSSKEPYKLKLPDCDMQCPLSNFKDLVKDVSVKSRDDFDQLCTSKHLLPDGQTLTIGILSAVIVLSILGIVSLYVYRNRHHRNGFKLLGQKVV